MYKSKSIRVLSAALLFAVFFLVGGLQNSYAQAHTLGAQQSVGDDNPNYEYVEDWSATKQAYYAEIQSIESNNNLTAVQKDLSKTFFKAFVKSLEKGNAIQVAKQRALVKLHQAMQNIPDPDVVDKRELLSRADQIAQ